MKHTFSGGDRTDWLGAWETFFVSGGRYDSAGEVRTLRRRDEIRPLIISLPTAFVGALLGFAAVYSIPLGVGRRGSRAKHLGKLVLFSLDVITPGIGPWRHDWGGNETFPVERAAVLSAAESAIGWVILALSSAVFVAWMVA